MLPLRAGSSLRLKNGYAQDESVFMRRQTAMLPTILDFVAYDPSFAVFVSTVKVVRHKNSFYFAVGCGKFDCASAPHRTAEKNRKMVLGQNCTKRRASEKRRCQ